MIKTIRIKRKRTSAEEAKKLFKDAGPSPEDSKTKYNRGKNEDAESSKNE